MARARNPLTVTALAAEEGSFLVHLLASDPAWQQIEDQEADGAVIATAGAQRSDRSSADRSAS